MTSADHHNTSGVLLAILASSGFGVLAFFAKQLFAMHLPIGHILMLRFWVATVIIWIFLIFRPQGRRKIRKIKFRDGVFCLLLGLFGYSGQSTLYFVALSELKSGLASILLFLYPAMIAVFVTVQTRKSPAPAQLFAIVAAFIGCILVIDFSDTSLTWLGIFAGVGAAFWLIASRAVVQEISPEIGTGFVFIGACIAFTIYVARVEGFTVPSWDGHKDTWGIIAGMAFFSTAVPVVSLFMAIEKIGVIRASIFSTLEPVVTILIGYFLLNEHLTTNQTCGAFLVLATLVWMRLKEIRQRKTA
jgi:drug/metabolite transporter (DMT)-like permease